MTNRIYRVILVILIALGIFFLGAIVDVANPLRNLIFTILSAALITIGYILGKGYEASTN